MKPHQAWIARIRPPFAACATSCAIFSISGCGSRVPASAALADVEEVRLSEGESAEVALGAGALSLADSVWGLYKSEDDSLLFRVRFGGSGEIVEVFDSFVLGQPWLGSSVTPDGQPHATEFAGGRYVAGGYCAEQSGRIGVVGVIHGLLSGAHLGTARVAFYGPLADDPIDGTFERRVTILGETPFTPPGDATFAAYAVLEE